MKKTLTSIKKIMLCAYSPTGKQQIPVVTEVITRMTEGKNRLGLQHKTNSNITPRIPSQNQLHATSEAIEFVNSL
jgi:hypothetical protein